MNSSDLPGIRLHEDAALFREALSFTAARTGFPAGLIEKDYFSTVLLAVAQIQALGSPPRAWGRAIVCGESGDWRGVVCCGRPTGSRSPAKTGVRSVRKDVHRPHLQHTPCVEARKTWRSAGHVRAW